MSTATQNYEIEDLLHELTSVPVLNTLIDRLLPIDITTGECSVEYVNPINPECPVSLITSLPDMVGLSGNKPLVLDPRIWSNVASTAILECIDRSQVSQGVRVIACCIDQEIIVDKGAFNEAVNYLCSKAQGVDCREVAKALLRVVLVHEITHCLNNYQEKDKIACIRTLMRSRDKPHYKFIEESLATAFEYIEAEKISDQSIRNLIRQFIEDNSVNEYAGYKAFIRPAEISAGIRDLWISQSAYYQDYYTGGRFHIEFAIYDVFRVFRYAFENIMHLLYTVNLQSNSQVANLINTYINMIRVYVHSHPGHCHIEEISLGLGKNYVVPPEDAWCDPLTIWGFMATGLELYAALKRGRPTYVL